MEKAIYFDMDGTIVDLYGYKGWLPELRAESTKPYEGAAPLLRLCELARRLNQLQRKGYHIGIVSWLSKCGTPHYNKEVTIAKINWLHKHLKSVNWDEIVIAEYGKFKEKIVSKPKGILFDDEESNRMYWIGKAYDETKIMEVLKAIS